MNENYRPHAGATVVPEGLHCRPLASLRQPFLADKVLLRIKTRVIGSGVTTVAVIAGDLMLRKGQLPLHPLPFIVLYLLGAAGPVLTFEPAQGMKVASYVAFVVAGILQIGWPVQAARYADSVLPDEISAVPNQRLKRLYQALTVLISTYSVVVTGAFFCGASPLGGECSASISVLLVVCLLTVFASFACVVLFAAQIICKAEVKYTGERIFVAILGLLYLLIGVPFIYRRLKRLASA
jgi:hypothetical protein